MDVLKSIAPMLDRPDIQWKKIIVGFFLAQYTFETVLSLRQYQVLQRKKPPQSLAGEVSQEVFDKSQAYSRAKAKFGFINGLYSLAQHLFFVYGDVYSTLWTITGGLQSRYVPARFCGEITQSVIFFNLFIVLSTFLALPPSLYKEFVLEEKFGFNKQTLSLFVTDAIKGQALATALGSPAIAALLAIIHKTGDGFYYYVWLFNIGLQLFMITIYPIVILPLFNKLSPLQDGPLKESVEALAKRLQFPLSNLFVIDGSKRSAHSNAYFFGLPWKKHIVIYDTLIEKSETQEIVAVLGHELGHWNLSHTIKLFALSQFHAFYILALFSVFIHNQSLYQAFGFFKEQPVFIGLLLFNEVLAPLDILITFTSNIISRKFEFEADEFAHKLGYTTELARSLIKLQIQNLSTMDADWLYATYHYSHPILPERLSALGYSGAKKGGEQLQEQNGKSVAAGVVKASDREL
ncbi:MAG: hypothetical protein M1826_001689 [Phylliscum demangeonii]|nr:MAG: hypothetical protein M1826_001689 [Phylliscum demangeonii]